MDLVCFFYKRLFELISGIYRFRVSLVFRLSGPESDDLLLHQLQVAAPALHPNDSHPPSALTLPS
jgi:hypothetical protein